MRKWDSVYRSRKENFTDWKKITNMCEWSEKSRKCRKKCRTCIKTVVTEECCAGLENQSSFGVL